MSLNVKSIAKQLSLAVIFGGAVSAVGVGAWHMTSPVRSADSIPSAKDALSAFSALIAPLPTVSNDQKETSLEVLAP